MRCSSAACCCFEWAMPARGLPFRISKWVDRTVTFVRGHRLGRLYCRPLIEWRAALAALGFAVRAIPLSQGTPFANVLLEARAR